MLKIESGLEKRPLKVVIYGAEGIGKSTFASQFPEPLFLDTEGGTSSLNIRRVKCGSSWEYFYSVIYNRLRIFLVFVIWPLTDAIKLEFSIGVLIAIPFGLLVVTPLWILSLTSMIKAIKVAKGR